MYRVMVMFDPIHYVATPVDTESGHPRPSYERPVAVVNCDQYIDITGEEGQGRWLRSDLKIVMFYTWILITIVQQTVEQTPVEPLWTTGYLIVMRTLHLML